MLNLRLPNIELWWEFTKNDFKLRYKKSILGALWVIFKPLALFYIVFTVWTGLMGTTSDSAFTMLGAIMLTNLFNETVIFGMQSLLVKSHIILKINFPREVVLLAATFIAFINYLLNLVVFIIISLVYKESLASLFVIKALFIGFTVYLLGVGLSFFLSILYVKFRDFIHLIEILLQLLFLATPVFYSVDMIKNNALLLNIIRFNPLTYLIIWYKNLFKPTSFNLYPGFYYTLIGILALLVLGNIYFKSKVKRLAEYY